MTKVVGVRFRRAGKIYYFDPKDLDIKVKQNIIVETARGVEFGEVVIANKDVPDDQIVQPLKQVIRLATEEDEQSEEENKRNEKEAFQICHQKIKKHKLEMKLIDCEYTFDRNKLLFYFTADGRIDFRELVKDLASVFKTRIELRQIGVRDETKMIGSVGICGRALCCHKHLSEFHPVSIKMAKDQNLSLNPTKISGVCGRLMCCLKYEQDTYTELNKKLPHTGDHVRTKDKLEGDVVFVSTLKQLVKVLVTKADGNKEIIEYKADEVRVKKPTKKQKEFIPEAEYRELKQLEKAEKAEKDMKRE